MIVMATHTTVRAVVSTDVVDAARLRAETEGKTLADAVVELLDAYAKGSAKPSRKTAARKTTARRRKT